MDVRLKQVSRLDDIVPHYRAVLCDVWGVIHNGVAYAPAAAQALSSARNRGVVVILVTNAPRPAASVIAQLDRLGFPHAAYDRVVTSGDVTRDLVAEGPRKVFHLGPERDLPLFDGTGVELVEAFEASVVVCTGLFDDETETPDNYGEMLRGFRSRNLPLVCANPDIVVERGDRLIYCAGALAQAYGQLGGTTHIAGKPHRPIYDLAIAVASEVSASALTRDHVLAIGDGVLTDIKGAENAGLEAVYVSGGIHAAEHGDRDKPDLDLMRLFLEKHVALPAYTMPYLK